MKKDIDRYELIENYLTDSLSSEERTDFEYRISTDPEFAARVEEHKMLSEFIEEGTWLEIRDSIRKIHDGFTEGTGSGISWKRILLFSAFVGITALIILVMRFRDRAAEDTLSPAVTLPLIDSVDQEEDIFLPSGEPITIPEESEELKRPMEIGKEAGLEIPRMKKPVPEDMITPENPDLRLPSGNETGSANISKPEKNIEPAMHSPGNREDLSMPPAPANLINCDSVSILAEVQTHESCEERPSGKIAVKIGSVRGASPPYAISIDNGNQFQQTLQIGNLAPGNYIVWVRDRNNCPAKIGGFLIGSVVCDVEYIFAPDEGELWEIPVRDKQGVIRIFTKLGSMIYTLGFSEGQKYYWDGNSLNGNTLPMGIYPFIIEYTDGTSLYGNVTIVR